MNQDANLPPEAFLDLEIRISPQRENTYPVELVVAGEQSFRGSMDAELDQAILMAEDQVAAGEALFHALLSNPDLRKGWDQAYGQSQKRRIRLNVDPAARELHSLPWELLRDGGKWLAAVSGTPFSRYLPVEHPWGRPARQQPLRVLAVISSPRDLTERYRGLAEVNFAAEQHAIRAELADLSGAVQVEFLDPPATFSRMEEHLQKGFAVLHVIGHGGFNRLTGSSSLLLQDEEGKARNVVDKDFSGMLARLPAPPRLVFLMACHSAARSSEDAFAGLAPRLVAAGVPAVLAMQGAMTMHSGQRLAEVFYRQLAAHGQVDRAVNEARSTLVTGGRPDAHLPVLFMRLASGRLWEEAPAPPPERVRPGRTINTGGGAYIEGSVHTGGGDFIGRDKINYAAPPAASPAPFRAIRQQIARLTDPARRAQLETAVTWLETEAGKGLGASEEGVLPWLAILAGLSPDVWQTAVNTFGDPYSGLPPAFQRAARRSASTIG